MKTYVVGTHQKRLTEALLMSTHKICFHWEIRKLYICCDHQKHLTKAFLMSTHNNISMEKKEKYLYLSGYSSNMWSQIRVYSVWLKILVLGYLQSTLQRLWPDCKDLHADLRHLSEGTISDTAGQMYLSQFSSGKTQKTVSKETKTILLSCLPIMNIHFPTWYLMMVAFN